MLNKTIADFKQYLVATGLKQYEAAEQLGIEKGHLNRILTGKRNLTPQMAVDMRRLMGEKDILSLEECMEKYPIGSFFVNFEFYFPDEYEPYMSREQCFSAARQEEDLYSPQKDDEGFTLSLIFQNKNTKKYQIITLWGEQITTYGTNDGLTFFPLSQKPKNSIYLGKKELSKFSLIDELLLSDFSNLKSVLEKSFKTINDKCGTDYLFFFTYEDFLKQGE